MREVPQKTGRGAWIHVVCKSPHEIVVAYLWQQRDWLPTHSLMSVKTGFGFIGSAGHVRAKELACNDDAVPDKLRNKVERRRGGLIGLNPKYEYFRHKPRSSEWN